MYHQNSSQVIKVVTKLLIQLQDMGLLETYQLSSSPKVLMTKDQLHLLLDQIKCLKLVLLEIKSLETPTETDPFHYNVVTTKHEVNEDQDEDRASSDMAQHDIDKAQETDFNLDLKEINQENKIRSKLMDISTLDNIINETSANKSEDSEGGIHEKSPLLGDYETRERTHEEGDLDGIGESVNLKSISVSIIEDKEDRKSDEFRHQFNYSESLKTPNPDFEDKKLSEPSSYIEIEPATPLLYENISKDLAEPDCDKVKSVDILGEIISREKETQNDENELKSADYLQETLDNDFEKTKKDATKKPVDIIEDMIREDQDSNEADIPKSEDFLREMITGKLNSENINAKEDLSTKPEDFIENMLKADSEITENVEKRSKPIDFMTEITSNKEYIETKQNTPGFIQDEIVEEKDKTKDCANKMDFLQEMIGCESKNGHESKPEDFIKEMISGKEDKNSNTPKKDDFIRDIVDGPSEDTETTKQTEEEVKHSDTQKEIEDREEDILENNEKQLINTINESDKETNIELLNNNNKSNDVEVTTHSKDVNDTNQPPSSDITDETNNKDKDKEDPATSISFLSEIPNVADATNNFMDQIIDSKPKTPNQLNFLEDLNTKHHGVDKAVDSKYESESLKTPKPVIAEDSTYYTEEHGYSFTVLDTQYKPQSGGGLYETDKSGSLYGDGVAKLNKKLTPFGVENAQDNFGFNYAESSSGNHGNKSRPSVPIHIEQNKIYERETEKDMNTFTIPSLSFFNCDNAYDEDTIRKPAAYYGGGDYNESTECNEPDGTENNYTEQGKNYENNLNSEYKADTGETNGENYEKPENYGEKYAHCDRNETYEQNYGGFGPYNDSYKPTGAGDPSFYDNTDPSEYSKNWQSGKDWGCSYETNSGYDKSTGYDSTRYEGFYENQPYDNQYAYDYQKESFHNYSYEYNYLNEETHQQEYSSCSYQQHSGETNSQTSHFPAETSHFDSSAPVFENQNDFMSTRYGMNFTAESGGNGIDETTGESANVMENPALHSNFNSTYETGQSDYYGQPYDVYKKQYGAEDSFTYNKTDPTYTDYSNYGESHACAVAQHYSTPLFNTAQPYQLSSSYQGDHMYTDQYAGANETTTTPSRGEHMNYESSRQVVQSGERFSNPYDTNQDGDQQNELSRYDAQSSDYLHQDRVYSAGNHGYQSGKDGNHGYGLNGKDQRTNQEPSSELNVNTMSYHGNEEHVANSGCDIVNSSNPTHNREDHFIREDRGPFDYEQLMREGGGPGHPSSSQGIQAHPIVSSQSVETQSNPNKNDTNQNYSNRIDTSQNYPNRIDTSQSYPNRNENKENVAEGSRGMEFLSKMGSYSGENIHGGINKDIREVVVSGKKQQLDGEDVLFEGQGGMVLEEQGESQSQDLKFFETLKKFTQPLSAFEIGGTQALKHTKSRLATKSAKKRLQTSDLNQWDNENSTEPSTLTYTQLRTPERENIVYTGDLKRLLISSFYNEDNIGLGAAVQKLKKSKTQLELNRSLGGHRESHIEQDGKGFCCEFCGTMFTTKHSLKYHHTTQHRLNPHQAFVCHVCSKPFHRKSVLIVHLQAHEGVKNFGCDYCPARFSQKISWRVHMMRHRGECVGVSIIDISRGSEELWV
uniref:Zinc finger and BTB domain-containing protein 20 n=1 Tax=Cacopsylla melanoneura TaxID=428564 RepID=A0A8D8QI52_9HEMI